MDEFGSELCAYSAQTRNLLTLVLLLDPFNCEWNSEERLTDREQKAFKNSPCNRKTWLIMRSAEGNLGRVMKWAALEK